VSRSSGTSTRERSRLGRLGGERPRALIAAVAALLLVGGGLAAGC